ncbi:MAG: hypothetical protein KDK33_10485 [Leptospiraceae bacterium]|nr:hypothetical protein [Leptospiraceae bacterium]
MKQFWKSPFQSMVFSSVVFGILSTLSLEPFNAPLVAYFCLWILFYQSRRNSQSIGRLIWFGLLAAFFLCVFAFYWTIHLFTVYGGLPLYLAVFIFIPYTFLLNLKIPFLTVFIGVIHRKGVRKYRLPALILLPTAAVLLDLILPQVFSWYWGNLLAGNPYYAQLAEYGGVHGLTFLYFFLAYGSFKLLKGNPLRPLYWKRFQRRYVWKAAWPVAAVAVLGLVFGFWKKSSIESMQASLPHAQVLTIQPDSPLEKSGEHEVGWNAIRTVMQETIPHLARKARKEATAKDIDVDLVVLPESAVPYYTTQDNVLTRALRFGYRPEYEELVLQLADMFDAEVFFNQNAFGLHRDERTGQVRPDVFNSSEIFGRDGKRKGHYHKQVLIAFGEQIPYAEFLDETGLINLVPESIRYSRFRAGKLYTLLPYQSNGKFDSTVGPIAYSPLSDPNSIKTDAIRKLTDRLSNRTFKPVGYFLPLICYEVLSPAYVRDFFNANTANPDFMVNITQDKWYGKTVESFQHFELGRLRAIETRRAIVRSTNSGVSGMIDLAGNYAPAEVGATLTGQETTEYQIFSVPVNRASDTIYVQIGDWWLIVPLLLLLGLPFLPRRRKGKGNSSTAATAAGPAKVQMPEGKTIRRPPTRRRSGK